jgi:hypothetical protein
MDLRGSEQWDVTECYEVGGKAWRNFWPVSWVLAAKQGLSSAVSVLYPKPVHTVLVCTYTVYTCCGKPIKWLKQQRFLVELEFSWFESRPWQRLSWLRVLSSFTVPACKWRDMLWSRPRLFYSTVFIIHILCGLFYYASSIFIFSENSRQALETKKYPIQ